MRLLTEDTQLSERLQVALSLAAKAMTVRAISLQPRAARGHEMDAGQQELVSRAMQADVVGGGDAAGAVELYRTALARLVAADNWTWPVSAPSP